MSSRDPGCTPPCWTPVDCPTCGGEVPPRGRSVEDVGDCCEIARYSPEHRRHLWHENDDARAYADAAWAVSPAGRRALTQDLDDDETAEDLRETAEQVGLKGPEGAVAAVVPAREGGRRCLTSR